MQKFISSTSSLYVLKKGEELHQQLIALASEDGLKSAWMNGIGASSSVTLGFYDPETKQYSWQDFDEPLEILSLQGNLSIVDGEPFWHVHGVFGRRDHTTLSGHVKQCVVGLTCEVAVTPIDIDVTRKFDAETGLSLLCPADS